MKINEENNNPTLYKEYLGNQTSLTYQAWLEEKIMSVLTFMYSNFI